MQWLSQPLVLGVPVVGQVFLFPQSPYAAAVTVYLLFPKYAFYSLICVFSLALPLPRMPFSHMNCNGTTEVQNAYIILDIPKKGKHNDCLRLSNNKEFAHIAES